MNDSNFLDLINIDKISSPLASQLRDTDMLRTY